MFHLLECEDEILFEADCQVTASSKISQQFRPSLALSVDSAWSPAVRDGDHWQEYLQFDFLDVARVGRIHVGRNTFGGNFRTAGRVRVTAAHTPGGANFGTVWEGDVPADNVVDLGRTVTARLMRIVILEAEDPPGRPVDAGPAPIGVSEYENAKVVVHTNNWVLEKKHTSFRVKFFGCLPKGHTPNLNLCLDNTLMSRNTETIDASDASAYRHFSVDDANDIVYFCDRSPFAREVDQDALRMFCYNAVPDENGGGDFVWTRTEDTKRTNHINFLNLIAF